MCHWQHPQAWSVLAVRRGLDVAYKPVENGSVGMT